MTAATLAIAAALAGAASAGGAGVPDRDALLTALDLRRHPNCPGDHKGCTWAETITVRALRCRRQGKDRATCRYQRRMTMVPGERALISNPRPEGWEAAEAHLVYDRAKSSWTVERESLFEPIAWDVGQALRWEEGRACRTLIDACIDGDGNDLFLPSDFNVSDLACRRLTPGRAACSFTSAKVGGESGEKARSCTGTLQHEEDSYGGDGWNFASAPRRVNSPLLRCE